MALLPACLLVWAARLALQFIFFFSNASMNLLVAERSERLKASDRAGKDSLGRARHKAERLYHRRSLTMLTSEAIPDNGGHPA